MKLSQKTHAFLTLALCRGEGSASRPGRFTPRERALHTPFDRRLGGPRVGLDMVAKGSSFPTPAGNRTLVVQPLA